jgi:hypothetical protein
MVRDNNLLIFRFANPVCKPNSQESISLQRIPKADHLICKLFNSPLAFFSPGVQFALSKALG